MKKFLALLLALVMALSLVACGDESATTPVNDGESSGTESEGNVLTVGLVLIGSESDQGYTFNFMRGFEKAAENMKAEGVEVKYIPKWNIGEDDGCETANLELAEAGCDIIINNSYGFEPYMLKVAPDYPDILFLSCTNMASAMDNLDNTINAFANIYEGRYVAGVVAGMKLNQMIEEGTITADEAVIGYVGAFTFAEVLSGYTAYYLGAKSVCPSVTMHLNFVGSWSDPTLEANAAQALIDEGCVLISQHSDNTTPATVAQENHVFHTGYNNAMDDVAPDASIISTRIDWSIYFTELYKDFLAGGIAACPVDWSKGFADDAVVLTDLNEKIAAPGTKEAVEKAIADIKSGAIKVFDTKNFTVEGKAPTELLADLDGDFTPETNVVENGVFMESDVAAGRPSAPYFAIQIDGITLDNVNFG